MTDGLNVEQIRPFELLQRAADYLGGTVCLTSTADGRERGTGRKLITLEPGAELRRLVVVRPSSDQTSRWRRLAHGTLLANRDLTPGTSLDDAALELANELHTKARRVA